jgi:non-ribosomal peptide synthetase component F
VKKTARHGIPGWADAATEPAWLESRADTSVAARFERVVAAAPDAVAFCSPAGETIGYGELNARANLLARLIRDRVEDPAAPVGLLARHPAQAITGMLGSLKAGHMYTPLDPSDPPSRLEDIFRDSMAGLIMTAPEHVSVASRLAGDRGEVVVIGRDDGNMPDTDLDQAAGLDHPAYLLYTSGSTGAPKGVLHSHRNLLHKGEVQRTFFGMGPGDRVSLLFGPATGAATSGIYGPLLNGGTVCPYDLKMHGLQHLGSWLRDRNITVLHMVPTIFRRFLGLGGEDDVYPNVRLLILPGEPTYRRDVELYRRHFGHDTVLSENRFRRRQRHPPRRISPVGQGGEAGGRRRAGRASGLDRPDRGRK